VSKPVSVQTYWRKIQIPGLIADRPGSTDRAITAPLEGIITQVHAYEGDIVQPGGKLFTIRLIGEYLQKTQSDFFKAVREIEILNK
jgi:multidrug efflux pump subunit AcrA (membrane-fusion protein)